MRHDDVAILYLDITENLVDAVVESASEDDREYVLQLGVSVDALCTCNGNLLGGRVCKHLRAALHELSKDELIDCILAGVTPRD